MVLNKKKRQKSNRSRRPVRKSRQSRRKSRLSKRKSRKSRLSKRKSRKSRRKSRQVGGGDGKKYIVNGEWNDIDVDKDVIDWKQVKDKWLVFGRPGCPYSEDAKDRLNKTLCKNLVSNVVNFALKRNNAYLSGRECNAVLGEILPSKYKKSEFKTHLTVPFVFDNNGNFIKGASQTQEVLQKCTPTK